MSLTPIPSSAEHFLKEIEQRIAPDQFAIFKDLFSQSLTLDWSNNAFLNEKLNQRKVRDLLPLLKEQDVTLTINTQHTSLIKYLLLSGFTFVEANSKIAVLTSKNELFNRLNAETKNHIEKLSSQGLGERAKNIKLNRYQSNLPIAPVDITPFEKRSEIPSEVLTFDPQAKNTFFSEDLEKVLAVRLYPTLRSLLSENPVEVFLGSNAEMVAYYRSRGIEILLEFIIPSSAIYYLAETADKKIIMIMAHLVGRENVMAQLLTLKLAGIEVEKIQIIGDFNHFSTLIQRDIDELLLKHPELQTSSRALIIAGCGLEEYVNTIVREEFSPNLSPSISYKGNILSLIHTSFQLPKGLIQGFIVLDLTYGESMETITRMMLERCRCTHVFSGGAAGALSVSDKPEIGTRIEINRCQNEQGEIVQLNDEPSPTHLHIPSIFLETSEWLHHARERGSSVDIETFYMIKAIQTHNLQNPDRKVEGHCGCFISDHVGEKPLREYSNVFVNYPEVLRNFLREIVAIPAPQTEIIYKPKVQTASQIKIQFNANDPRRPQAPRLESDFLSSAHLTGPQEAYRASIIALNPDQSPEKLFLQRLWNVDYYKEENYPVALGRLSNPDDFSLWRNGVGLRFLDLPIFMPNQGWQIPPELIQFKEVIAKAVEFESLVNPNFEKKCYVYITVDQGVVQPGQAQRRTGWHGDSFLRLDNNKKKVKVACDHIYVAADACPTPFLPQPFPLDEINPENIDEVLAHFAKLAEGKSPVFYPPYTVLRATPYCVHNVGFNHADHPVKRTFVKITFSENRFGDLGNARNPLFTYDWPMIPRHGVPYDINALRQSAHRKDRDKFSEVNPMSVDFTQDECTFSWVKSKIESSIRTHHVHAVKATEDEMLTTINDGFLVTILVAEPDDWKLTASHGDQYFLSGAKLEKFYAADTEEAGKYNPKPVPRKFAVITENIRFMSSWGTMQYAQKGDILMCAGKDDVYAIPRALFDDEFEILTTEYK